MSNRKTVVADHLDSDLTKVADAIRAKTGTTEDLDFPGGFLSELDRIIGGDYLGDVTNKTCSQLISAGMTGTLASSYQKGNTNLTKVDLKSITAMQNNVFASCTNLVFASLESVTTIGAANFQECNKLSSLSMPNLETITGWGWNFASCRDLVRVHFPKLITLTEYDFSDCTNLTTVILGANTVCTLASNVFRNTPIANGTGRIYVPSNLVDSYKAASGWSTYANQIVAITGNE